MLLRPRPLILAAPGPLLSKTRAYYTPRQLEQLALEWQREVSDTPRYEETWLRLLLVSRRRNGPSAEVLKEAEVGVWRSGRGGWSCWGGIIITKYLHRITTVLL